MVEVGILLGIEVSLQIREGRLQALTFHQPTSPVNPSDSFDPPSDLVLPNVTAGEAR